jgi:hypothetical protein
MLDSNPVYQHKLAQTLRSPDVLITSIITTVFNTLKPSGYFTHYQV